MWKALFHFSEKGPRNENQDAVFCWTSPDGVSAAAVLCDGVGGNPCGATASALVTGHLGHALRSLLEKKLHPDRERLSELVSATQLYVQEEALRQPLCQGMATTVAALVVSGDTGVWQLHAGDSRIYHIRNGCILSQTEDHTPVNDLLRQGIITPEEAAASPRSSRISRAIRTGPGQSPSPEITLRDDVREGDLFFLCSDGVWAYVNETDWLACLSEAGLHPERASQKLQNLCTSLTRDNFSAILLTLLAGRPT